MKAKSILGIAVFMIFSLTAFSQNTGTLKVFSEEPVIVFVDQVQHPSYDAITLSAGTHYVKVLNKNEERVYNNIVTIIENQVTSVLIETDATPDNQPAAVKPASTKGTGTINIFSEFTGTSIYLNENKLPGNDIKTINSVPAGDHYVKVMKDGVSIFGELVTVTAGKTTAVLVKNDGQAAEKILESKSQERQTYQAKKIDVLFTTNAVSTTSGSSTYFPGYYGYYGYSSAVTNTQQVSDFKIVQGGVKEIGDMGLANAVNNADIINRYTQINKSVTKQTTIGALTFLGTMAVGIPVLVCLMGDKHYLHKDDPSHPDWEYGVVAGAVIVGTISYYMTMNADKKLPRHYYRVDEAAKDAKKHNDKLKKDLGLPESYDVK